MTAKAASKLNDGDKVTHAKDGFWDCPEVVERVDDELFPDDPVVFFRGGGFWRSSRLVRVTA